MSMRRIVGLVLIAIGLVALASGGLSWTHREKVIDAGPVQVSREKHERVSLPPLVGGIVLVSGVVLLAIPGRTRA